MPTRTSRLTQFNGWACLVLSFSARSGIAQSTGPQGDVNAPVAIRFDWGSELDARVVAVRRAWAGKTPPSEDTLNAQYRLRAHLSQGRYRLEFEDLKLRAGSMLLPEKFGSVERGRLSGLVLSYDILRNGGFGGFTDFDELRRGIQEQYRAKYAGKGSPEQIERMIEATTMRKDLESEAAYTWDVLVGAWVGKRLTMNTPISGGTTQIMMLPINRSVAAHTQIELLGWEPCTAGAKEKSCIRLRRVAYPDREKLRDAIHQAVAQSMGPAASTSVERRWQLDARCQIELITEPRTLKPHWAQWSRTTVVNTKSGNGERTEENTDSTTLTFTYSAKQ